jgi:hypothetical protein
VAQEKAHIFRTGRRHNPATGAACPWIVSATGVVNHQYYWTAPANLEALSCRYD